MSDRLLVLGLPGQLERIDAGALGRVGNVYADAVAELVVLHPLRGRARIGREAVRPVRVVDAELLQGVGVDGAAVSDETGTCRVRGLAGGRGGLVDRDAHLRAVSRNAVYVHL